MLYGEKGYREKRYIGRNVIEGEMLQGETLQGELLQGELSWGETLYIRRNETAKNYWLKVRLRACYKISQSEIHHLRNIEFDQVTTISE